MVSEVRKRSGEDTPHKRDGNGDDEGERQRCRDLDRCAIAVGSFVHPHHADEDWKGIWNRLNKAKTLEISDSFDWLE